MSFSPRPLLPTALLLALAACQSSPSQNQQAAATTPSAKPGAEPTTTPTVQNSPGASYTTYRGLLAGQPDSLTLHLVTTSQPHYDNSGPSSRGSYYGPDGHPYDLGSRPSAPDSLVLVDYSPEHGVSSTTEPPVWRLVRHPDGRLTGLAGGRAIVLQPVPVPAGALTFAVRTLADSLAAYPARPASPKIRLSWQALVPVGGPAALAASILRDERGDTTDAQVPLPLAALFAQRRDTLFSDYRADIKGLTASPDEQPSASLNYDSQLATYVLFERDNLLSLVFFNYDYTGGAHGMDITRAASYDLRTGRRLRYDDLFQPEAAAQLPALLAVAVRPLVGLKSGEALNKTLFVSRMPVTHNVFLTTGGVEFIYQPYEIAAYAQGEVRVFLPLGQVRALLKEGLPLPAPAGVAKR